MTWMLSFVTPWYVAPPLSLPSGHLGVQTGPKPSKTKLIRPNVATSGSQSGFEYAAAVLIPEPAGGLPTPSGTGWGPLAAAPADVIGSTTPIATSAASATTDMGAPRVRVPLMM